MLILADLHHADLFHSLQMLFEDRIGAELYRPIGMDWYHEGYWHVFPHIDTAKQYLATDQARNTPKDIHGKKLPPGARVNEQYRIEDGIYYVTDVTKDRIQRGITLKKFKEMKFDILISSIPQHIGPFNKLISYFQPRAKHIFQVGNAWGHQPGVRNILASTAPFKVPNGVNTCFYHQEFDLDKFSFCTPMNNKDVCSYIHYMQGKEIMNRYAAALPLMKFRSYGAGMEDHIMKTTDIAKRMIDSAFTWHYKPGGDGYGHVIHSTYACGRPALVWKEFYKGKLAERLLIDGVTCIDLSIRSEAANVKLIQNFSRPEKHREMCSAAFRRFEEIISFDEDEAKVRKFLSNLL